MQSLGNTLPSSGLPTPHPNPTKHTHHWKSPPLFTHLPSGNGSLSLYTNPPTPPSSFLSLNHSALRQFIYKTHRVTSEFSWIFDSALPMEVETRALAAFDTSHFSSTPINHSEICDVELQCRRCPATRMKLWNSTKLNHQPPILIIIGMNTQNWKSIIIGINKFSYNIKEKQIEWLVENEKNSLFYQAHCDARKRVWILVFFLHFKLYLIRFVLLMFIKKILLLLFFFAKIHFNLGFFFLRIRN